VLSRAWSKEDKKKMKNLLAGSILLSLILAVHVASAAEIPTLDVSAQNINSKDIPGPEGITLGPDGTIYLGGHDGVIRAISPTGEMREFADLNDLPGKKDERIGAVGIAMSAAGDIYAAAFDFNGGSVLKVLGPQNPDAGQVSLFRNGIGLANFILIDNETSTMYVSDSSMFSGRVFRFDMNDESNLGTTADPERDVLGKFRYANGLALHPDGKWLYVAETTSGRISKVNLETKESTVFAQLGGWTDGLYLDPSRNLLFACDNRGGRITVVDLSGKVVGDVRLMGKEGQCAPASLIFIDPDTIAFTDLWRASLIRALLRSPQYHSYAYRLKIGDILR
jgi:sugar lactone lactonase YvrE